MRTTSWRGDVRLVLPPFCAGKLLTLAVGYLTVWSGGGAPGLPDRDQLSAAFSNWDGESYRAIAEHGYPPGPLDLHAGAAGHLWAFFPGFPLAARAVALLLGGVVLAGIVVNIGCELLALVYLVRLVRLERGDTGAAVSAAWLLALYPYAVFLTVMYSEAPFLAAATASLYYMRAGDHPRACLAAALAMAVRITAIALPLPLLLEYLQRRRWRPGPGALLVPLTLLPLALFMLYAQLRTADATAYFDIEGSESFGSRHLVPPWQGLQLTWESARVLPANGYGFVFTLEVVFGLLGIALAVLAWVATLWPLPRLAPSQALYCTGVILPPVCLTFWVSLPRYVMAMVPILVLAADALRRAPAWRVPVYAVSGGLMALGTTILLSGRFLA